jgi:hypothetical protein
MDVGMTDDHVVSKWRNSEEKKSGTIVARSYAMGWRHVCTKEVILYRVIEYVDPLQKKLGLLGLLTQIIASVRSFHDSIMFVLLCGAERWIGSHCWCSCLPVRADGGHVPRSASQGVVASDASRSVESMTPQEVLTAGGSGWRTWVIGNNTVNGLMLADLDDNVVELLFGSFRLMMESVSIPSTYHARNFLNSPNPFTILVSRLLPEPATRQSRFSFRMSDISKQYCTLRYRLLD